MEKIEATEYMIKEFEMHYPQYMNKVIEYQEGEPFELIVKLNDGNTMSYYVLDKTFRRLPSESDIYDDDKCKREFGILLHHMMCRKGFLQNDLSEATGISQSRLSNYINGKMWPSFINLAKIAKALNCSMDDFQIFRKF